MTRPRMAHHRWRTVLDAVAQEIRDGTLEPGDRLPPEAELARRHGVGRHSVRRAVGELARQGALRVEQGSGTYVEDAALIAYAIGKRTRLRRNLMGQVSDLSGRDLGWSTIPAPGRVARALRLAEGAEVTASRRLTLADDLPVAVGTIHHDPARFPDYPARRAACGSVTAAYRSYGVEDYLRGETSLHARPARAEESEALRQHPDLPVILVRATDTLRDGTPIAHSEVTWSASRVRFTVGQDD